METLNFKMELNFKQKKTFNFKTIIGFFFIAKSFVLEFSEEKVLKLKTYNKFKRFIYGP